jgi:hypothetical protein
VNQVRASLRDAVAFYRLTGCLRKVRTPGHLLALLRGGCSAGTNKTRVEIRSHHAWRKLRCAPRSQPGSLHAEEADGKWHREIRAAQDEELTRLRA